MLVKNYYLFTVLIVSKVLTASADCEINPFREKAPLLIGPEINSNGISFIYPEYGTNTIQFNINDEAEFACPGAEVVYGEIRTPTAVKATCVSRDKFEIHGKHFSWQDIYCSSDPFSKVRGLKASSRCGNNAELVEIGFDLGRNRFLSTILICFDTVNETPLYSKYTIHSNINFGDNLRERPFFLQDEGFYRKQNIDHFYTRNRQRSTINKLIGLHDTSTKYIKDDKRFLSRGHLAAKKDFFYKPAQSATFRLINAAPQWQSFNGDNWNQVEIDTRNYASNNKLNLEVYTGTYGLATLPHETSYEDIPLNLFINGNQKSLPVPAIFWKIVYDNANNKGIVLIGLNNPYKKDDSHIICPDVSDQVNWLTWDKFDIEKGYSYACTIKHFRYAVYDQIIIPSNIPDLGHSELLN